MKLGGGADAECSELHACQFHLDSDKGLGRESSYGKNQFLLTHQTPCSNS